MISTSIYIPLHVAQFQVQLSSLIILDVICLLYIASLGVLIISSPSWNVGIWVLIYHFMSSDSSDLFFLSNNLSELNSRGC